MDPQGGEDADDEERPAPGLFRRCRDEVDQPAGTAPERCRLLA